MASSYTYDLQFNYRNYKETAFLTVVITADAAAGDVDSFSTDDMTYFDGETITRKLKGFNLMYIDTIPGTGADAPGAVYTVDVTDGSTPALTIADLNGRSVTAKERYIVSDATGYWDDVDSVYNTAVGDLGNSNVTTLVYAFKQD